MTGIFSHGRARSSLRADKIAFAFFPAILLAGACLRGSAEAAPAKTNAAHDFTGIYWANSYSAKIQPMGGGDPPFKPEAMAQYKKNMADMTGGKLEDNARTFCLPDGIPRILGNPYPFEIFQADNRNEIYFLYELNHVIRHVAMNQPMPPEKTLFTFPFYSGHSVGHWDGDTLVVQTAGYKDFTFLDNAGAPHSDQLETEERIRRINDGKQLEDIVTIHDPAVFTKDWTARYVYESRPDVRIADYVCAEKHRDLSSVKGVNGH